MSAIGKHERQQSILDSDDNSVTGLKYDQLTQLISPLSIDRYFEIRNFLIWS